MTPLRILILFVLTSAPLRLCARSQNLLFILVDDFGARDLGCYGSALYETPNMNRLAASGARFTQAYVAYPRCVPSRYAIMTGKLPARVQEASRNATRRNLTPCPRRRSNSKKKAAARAALCAGPIP